MRIGVDARHLSDGRGVARYTERTLAALAAGFPNDEWVLVVPGHEPVRAPRADNVEVRRTRAPGRAVFAAGAAFGRPSLERLAGGGLDAVWLPAPAPVGLAGDAPLVLTVHDLSFEERPGDFTPYERLWHRAGRLRAQALSAARVTAVSTPTRDALIARWGIEPARISVVAPGVWAPPSGASPRAATTRPYLLCVAALEPRKAPELLLGAYLRARAHGLDADLVFAGPGRLAPRLAGRPGVTLAGQVDGDRLDALYGGALAVVLPSWLEGFGLPPLEGLARGVPAIVADLPVYDETLGAGALRFAPGDAEGLAQALLRVAADAPLRAQLVAAGRAAIARLTWERTAAGVRAALAEAAAS